MTWQVASFSLLALVVVGGFAWYERSRPSAKVLALVAALAALAVVGRLAFAPFPNVKPTTDIVLLSGYALGGAPGFCVGAVAALVSNFFFGQGPWTPWQMAAWGGVGVAGALLARLAHGRELGRLPLALACGAAALAFGAVMDVYQWTLAAEQTLGSYVVVSGRSLPFNAAHVVASVAFCLAIGPPLVSALRRYRRRLEVTWPPSPAPTASGATTGPRTVPLATVAAALVVGASLLVPVTAIAGTGEAVSYLVRAQNRDGGFGDSPRSSSRQLYTVEAALGLAAGGRNPLDVAKGGRSTMDYLRRNAGSLRSTGDLSRTIMVVEASGGSARSFGGRNLVDDLRSRKRQEGSYDGLVNQTAFAVLALKAAGVGGLGESAHWIARRQNGDGGFGFNAGQSSPDVTGAALQALAAAGMRGSGSVDRALRYLGRAQRGNGGFGQYQSSDSNTQSTAWAAQGLAAAGKNPERFTEGGRSPLDYIRSLQAADGSFRYAGGNGQTPVWVTAQAIPALEREAFPLRPVARKRGGGGGGGGPSAGHGGAGRDGSGEAGGYGGAGENGGDLPGAGAGDPASLGPDPEAGRASLPGSGRGPGGGEAARGPRRGGGGSPSLPTRVESEEAGELTPVTSDDGATPSSRGSVIGGLIAAASSAAFVLGVRRRLNGRAEKEAPG